MFKYLNQFHYYHLREHSLGFHKTTSDSSLNANFTAIACTNESNQLNTVQWYGKKLNNKFKTNDTFFIYF